MKDQVTSIEQPLRLVDGKTPRKATAEEIIEHFKEK